MSSAGAPSKEYHGDPSFQELIMSSADTCCEEHDGETMYPGTDHVPVDTPRTDHVLSIQLQNKTSRCKTLEASREV